MVGNELPVLWLEIVRQPENYFLAFRLPFVCGFTRHRALPAIHRRGNFYAAIVEGIERAAVSDADDDALRQALAD